MAAEYGLEGAFTFKTDASIVYDRTKDGGSSLARQNLALEMSANGTVKMATDGAKIIGYLLDVFGDNTCSACCAGILTFKQGAQDGVTVNTSIVGGAGPSIGGQTNGYVKSAPNSVVGARAGRGIALDVHSNTAGGEVSVLLP